MGDFKRGGFGGGRSGGFKKGGFGGDRGGFGGRRGGFGGGRDRGPVEMFPVVCAECGKDCKVPFKPTSDKPVYCNDCFGSKKDSQPRNDFGGRGRKNDFSPRDGGNDEIKRKIESIERKIDSIIEILDGIELVDEEVEEKEEKKSKKKS